MAECPKLSNLWKTYQDYLCSYVSCIVFATARQQEHEKPSGLSYDESSMSCCPIILDKCIISVWETCPLACGTVSPGIQYLACGRVSPGI